MKSGIIPLIKSLVNFEYNKKNLQSQKGMNNGAKTS